MFGIVLSPFWCGVVSVLIGAVSIAAFIAGICGLAWLVSRIDSFFKERKYKYYKSLKVEDYNTLIRKNERRKEIWNNIGSGAMCVVLLALLLGLAYLIGSPACDGLLHHGR